MIEKNNGHNKTSGRSAAATEELGLSKIQAKLLNLADCVPVVAKATRASTPSRSQPQATKASKRDTHSSRSVSK